MEADERKKEREVKLTDRLPPPKRARGCKLNFVGSLGS
jgi:elongin-A